MRASYAARLELNSANASPCAGESAFGVCTGRASQSSVSPARKKRAAFAAYIKPLLYAKHDLFDGRSGAPALFVEDGQAHDACAGGVRKESLAQRAAAHAQDTRCSAARLTDSS